MRHTLLDRENANVIVTGWGEGASFPYEQATGNTRLVGAQVAELITFLMRNRHVAADSFYLVGFSLGAHIAGYAGARMREGGHPIGRITGTNGRSVSSLYLLVLSQRE